MPTVLEIQRQAEIILARHGVDSPRLSAQILLAKVLGISRLDLLLGPERDVTADLCRVFDALIARRGLGEPVAYLVGNKEFYGLDFQVDSQVLIPRPETEEMIEHVSRQWDADRALVFADLGTGSGVLAVTLAHLFPRAAGFAVDIEPGALLVARANARRHGVLDRVTLVRADFLTPFPPSCLDLVISNPPYVTEAEYQDLSFEVAGYEPRQALVAGKDGLDCFRAIEGQARAVLRPGGSLWAEMGWLQGGQVRELFAAWSSCRIVRDLGGRDRFVHAVR